MIVVDGLPLPAEGDPPLQGGDLLLALLEHPKLVSASRLLVSTSVKSAREVIGDQKHVYVFQREYATVDPQLVQFIGTDEATTCVGIVVRNQQNGMTSIAHFDTPKVVDSGLAQMLLLVSDHGTSAPIDVHLIGAFKDANYQLGLNDDIGSKSVGLKEGFGYSFPLCSKIIEALQSSKENFQLRTLCVLEHNTTKGRNGYPCPVLSGFLLETASGSIIPTSFDMKSRCPDELVRRLRVTVSSETTDGLEKLLETYDTKLDRFIIAPFSWNSNWGFYARSIQKLSDQDFLFECSTSPFAEGEDFVKTQRSVLTYLTKYPNWKQTFPKSRARIFNRTIHGGWKLLTADDMDSDGL